MFLDKRNRVRDRFLINLRIVVRYIVYRRFDIGFDAISDTRRAARDSVDFMDPRPLLPSRGVPLVVRTGRTTRTTKFDLSSSLHINRKHRGNTFEHFCHLSVRTLSRVKHAGYLRLSKLRYDIFHR